MHIYIQRGGRRPSNSSLINLSKSRSLQSLQDTSPRFREKILEYDQRRREEEKLKPKPKLKPLPINPPPKPERKKYIPSIPLKPKIKKPIPEEKSPIIEYGIINYFHLIIFLFFFFLLYIQKIYHLKANIQFVVYQHRKVLMKMNLYIEKLHHQSLFNEMNEL